LQHGVVAKPVDRSVFIDKEQWSNEALLDAQHLMENGQAGSASKAYMTWIHQLEKDTYAKRP
jgi:hypothetical protein